jgi:hypothetical protein
MISSSVQGREIDQILRIVWRMLGLISACALLLVLPRAGAQTVTASASSTTLLAEGGQVTLTLSASYEGLSPTALGWEIALPMGWSFVSASGVNVPNAAVPPTGTTGLLEFATSSPPTASASFTANVRYPAGVQVTEEIVATFLYRSPLQTIQLAPIRFTPSGGADPIKPTLSGSINGLNLTEGQTGELSVSASGTAPLTYQWLKDGVAISGAMSSTLMLSTATLATAGRYSVVVTNAAGSVTSADAVVAVEPLAARIGNVSIRTTLSARQVLIVGLTMTGGDKPVLMRAVGPSLGSFGVTGTMPDPSLSLYAGAAPIAANDDWGGITDLVSASAAVGAFALSASSKDAVLLRPFSGGRTLQVQGAEAGNVLVEAYDAGSGHTPRLVNVSARNVSGSGGDALIAGFSILGNTSKRVLIRAVGPTLGSFGVLGAQADPKLEVYSGSNRIADNDNWLSPLASTFTAVGAFALPAGSRDAAVELTLAPGGYTVHVSPASGVAGEVLIEIYEVP